MSNGGVLVSIDSKVLDTDYNAIPGLYCVGAECSGLTGDAYYMALSAVRQSQCICSNRNAAKNAHAYINT